MNENFCQATNHKWESCFAFTSFSWLGSGMPWLRRVFHCLDPCVGSHIGSMLFWLLFIYKSCLSPPVSSLHGISQARILKCIAIFFAGDLPNPGIKPASPALAGRFFMTKQPGKPIGSIPEFNQILLLLILANRFPPNNMFAAAAVAAKLLQSCLTLCDPIDGIPPGSPGKILQARTLEWVAISFSSA